MPAAHQWALISPPQQPFPHHTLGDDQSITPRFSKGWAVGTTGGFAHDTTFCKGSMDIAPSPHSSHCHTPHAVWGTREWQHTQREDKVSAAAAGSCVYSDIYVVNNSSGLQEYPSNHHTPGLPVNQPSGPPHPPPLNIPHAVRHFEGSSPSTRDNT